MLVVEIMVLLPGDEKRTIQIIHDAGGVDDNYFKMMDVEFVEGSFFTERNDSSRQIIIDERGWLRSS